MANQGLVTRMRSAEDERTVEVTCTEAGHALRERVRVVQAEVECATGLAGVELATLRAELHEVAARLRERPSEVGATPKAAR